MPGAKLKEIVEKVEFKLNIILIWVGIWESENQYCVKIEKLCQGKCNRSLILLVIEICNT